MARLSPSTPRMPLIDVIKAVSCLAIVAHHLAFYGPMSDFAYPLSHPLFDGLYRYGRMAVQAFLVVAGFLCAMHVVATPADRPPQPWRAIARRYVRLVVPLAAALTLAILCSGIARRWMQHESISAVPNPWQLLAHLGLVQDLVDQEALSAGVWYLAIDFQLFACMALLFALGERWRRVGGPPQVAMLAVAGLTFASLMVFNLDDAWDETGLFYFAYYGLGALVYALSDPGLGRRGVAGMALLAAVVVAGLLLDFRGRIVVAGVVALALGAARYRGMLYRWEAPAGFIYLGKISFSIFLVHFPVCLLVNAAFFRFLPHDPLTSAGGLLLAWCLSVLAGATFYTWVEGRRLTATARWGVIGLFLATGMAAWWLQW